MSKSKIEWTDRVWNPVIGCSKVSEGCRNCYAERMAHRMNSNPGTPQYHGLTKDGRWTGEVRVIADKLDQPTRWRKPVMVFVNSMSDLFHDSVTFDLVASIFGVMAHCGHHTFQVLTKRPARACEFFSWAAENRAPLLNGSANIFCRLQAELQVPEVSRIDGPWPLPNVWLGVSVEDQKTADERIPLLLQTPAAVRWVSLEPMLGPVDLTAFLDLPVPGLMTAPDPEWGERVTLDWVVLGGESGSGARPMHPDWVRSVRDQCNAAAVPFLFKQWGEWLPEIQNPRALSYRTAESAVYVDTDGAPAPARYGARGGRVTCQRVGKRKAGRKLDGVVHDEYPT